jgi:hypothetical protein
MNWLSYVIVPAVFVIFSYVIMRMFPEDDKISYYKKLDKWRNKNKK